MVVWLRGSAIAAMKIFHQVTGTFELVVERRYKTIADRSSSYSNFDLCGILVTDVVGSIAGCSR